MLMSVLKMLVLEVFLEIKKKKIILIIFYIFLKNNVKILLK